MGFQGCQDQSFLESGGCCCEECLKDLFLQECQSALGGCQEELEFSAASCLALQLFVAVGSG